MKQTVNFYDFCDAFHSHGRQDSFSYEGKRALFDWIEEIDEECGTETELDVIALDCYYSEYASALDCIKDYDFTPEGDDEEKEESAAEWLREQTILIAFDGGIIIQDF